MVGQLSPCRTVQASVPASRHILVNPALGDRSIGDGAKIVGFTTADLHISPLASRHEVTGIMSGSRRVDCRHYLTQNCSVQIDGIVTGTGTFRAQERIVPMGNFRSRVSFPGNESSLELSFPGPFVPGKRKFLGTFVPWTFRSEELSFLRLFYKALAMNADSYSSCQNLFRSRPSSVCFPKIN